MRQRLGIATPRAPRGSRRRATGLLACFAFCILLVSTAMPNAGAQSVPGELETCGYLNVVLTASGSVAVDAAKSLKEAAGSDLDADEVASLDSLVETGTTIDGAGADKLKARHDESCQDLDYCPLIESLDSDDVEVMSKSALVLRDLSQPVPPSVALAFRDLIDADDADAPFTAQRDRLKEYFADKNCSGTTTSGADDDSSGDAADSGSNDSSDSSNSSSNGGTSTSGTGGTGAAATPTPRPTAVDAAEVADKAEHALNGSPTATAVPTTGATAPVVATPTATGTGALPNTGLGTQALYFSFAAAALVALGAWLLAVPGIRR